MIGSKKIMKYFMGVGFLLCALITLPQKAGAVSASDWNPGRIIDDSVFQNKNAMSIQQIQQFLNSKVASCDRNGDLPISSGGQSRRSWAAANGKPAPPYTCLKEYVENPTTKQNNLGNPTGVVPGGKSAAELIWDASQQQNINPQVLLTLIQKEQSLVTDDWPWPIQFLHATGNNCPDTAPCNPIYEGFWTQIINSGAQFNYYVNHFNEYNYAPGQNNILYNPNAACGSRSVFIENAFTAALYIYTPYTPNQAALNNMYGTGDSCSAYGNRNFWRLFNDWFGPSRQGEFSLVVASDLSSPTQYLLLNNILYPIPNPEIKEAWGLLDTSLVGMDANYLANLPRGPSLTRVVRPNGSLDVFFIDGQKKYRFPSYDMMLAWGYSASSVTDLPASLTNHIASGGSLLPSVYRASLNEAYLVDGGTLRKYADQKTIKAWEGNAPYSLPLSESFFTNTTEGSPISNHIVKSGPTAYLISNGKKSELDSNLLAIMGQSLGSVPSISSATLGRLDTQQASHFIKSSDSPTVYMIDGGSKRQVLSPNIFTAWSINRQQYFMTVTNANLEFFTNGSPISNYAMKTSSGPTYIIDGSLITPKSNQSSDQVLGIQTVTQEVLNRYPVGQTSTKLYKNIDASQPGVYLIMAGKKYRLTTVQMLQSWGGNSSNITSVSTGLLEQFPDGGNIDTYVKYGSNNYLVDLGRLIRLDGEAALTWNGSTPTELSAGIFQDFNIDSRVLNGPIDGNTADYFLSNGVLYVSSSPHISSIWNLGSGPSVSDIALARLTNRSPLTKFAKSISQSDQRIFLKDTSALYTLTSPQQVYNLGYQNDAPVQLLANTLQALSPTEWHTPLARDSSGQYFIIEGAGKRTFADIPTRDQWIGDRISQPALSYSLLETLASKQVITKSIKGTSDTVYAVIGLQKKHVTNPGLYVSQYAPFTSVSNDLVYMLSTGTSL